MDEEKVIAVREELRNGRRTSKTARADVENTGVDTTGDGSILKVLSRESEGANRPDRGSNHTDRSIEAESIRERRAIGRLGEDNRRANDPVSVTATANTRTVGRLAAEEPIPSRLPEPELPEEPKRGRGRPRKEVEPEPKESPISRVMNAGKAVVKDGKPLSKKEAEELKEPLIAALADDFQYLDEALWWWSHDDSEPQIWSDIDDEEIEILARTLIRRGERSPGAANAVRNIVDGADYLSTAVIMVPRMIKSMQQVNKRPKRKRKQHANTH